MQKWAIHEQSLHGQACEWTARKEPKDMINAFYVTEGLQGDTIFCDSFSHHMPLNRSF